MMLLKQHTMFFALGLFSWALALAQTPAFEAASVRISTAGNTRGRTRGGPETADPGQITFSNVTLTAVLLRAYDVKVYQVAAPDWMSSRRYDIVAKIPPDTSKEQFNLMLQNLLRERFHLALHHETREVRGFELVAARNGTKLKPSKDAVPGEPAPDSQSPPKTDANGFPQMDGPGLVLMEGMKGSAVVTFLTAKAQPLSALVDVLSREFRMPILDHTGLSGKFDFNLEFAPQPPGAAPPVEADESGPNLVTAVQQQLGLKLNQSKFPLDMLVVDRADQVPTEN